MPDEFHRIRRLPPYVFAEVNTAKANWLKAVQTYQAINTEAKPVVRDLRNFLMGAFGEGSPQLADFGFASKKS